METFHFRNPHAFAQLSPAQEAGLFVLRGPAQGPDAANAFAKPFGWGGDCSGVWMNLRTDVEPLALAEGLDTDLLTLTGPDDLKHGRFEQAVRTWDATRAPVEGLAMASVVVNRGALRELWASRLELGVQRALENGFDPAEGNAMLYVRKLQQVRQVLGLSAAP